MKNCIRLLAALSLIVVPVLAEADDASKAMGGMDMGGGRSPADKAFALSMRTMMKDMATRPTGRPDTDFVTMMIPHHQGAIDMARVELQYGKDPMLRQLANDIVKAQETEIAEMKDWLAKHGK